MSLQRTVAAGIALSVILFTSTFSENVNDVAAPNIVFEALALNRDIATAANPLYLSPTDIVPSPDKRKLYIAEKTAKRIAIVNIETGNVTKNVKLPNEVTPWDHIGSSLSMDSVSINRFHSAKAYKLSDPELKDLVEFVLSL